jgi:hypothetical protein
VGDNKASGTTWATSDTDTYESYGGASDQWGEAWNLSDIQNAGFGVAIAATESAGTKTNVFMDHVQLTVYYNPPACSDPDVAVITIDPPTSSSTVSGSTLIRATVSNEDGTMSGMNVTTAGTTSCDVTGVAMTDSRHNEL